VHRVHEVSAIADYRHFGDAGVGQVDGCQQVGEGGWVFGGRP
jgi:hypothetical protein